MSGDDFPFHLPVGGAASPHYVQPPANRPAVLRPPVLPIPTVDLGLLLHPDHSPTETAKLHLALSTYGFFHAVNHGIPSPLLHRLLSSARDFLRSAPTQLLSGSEGYGVDAVVREDQILDWSRRLYLLIHPERERRLDLWPPPLTDLLLEYDDRCRPVAETILAAIGDALGLGRSYFAEELVVYDRLNYYPICETPELVVGLKPHNDASAITLVLQDPEVPGGLQVLAATGGDWAEVPVVPGALLVNVGDQIEIMSNGMYKSPMHRVVTNGEKERISVVCFYSMAREKEIGPATSLLCEGRGRKYKNITVNEYLEAFYRVYPVGGTTIDTVKIPP